MSETHAKRARAQNKQMNRKEKAERKKLRRDQAIAQPTPDVVDPSYFFDFEDTVPPQNKSAT
jgi:hypothetical protein